MKKSKQQKALSLFKLIAISVFILILSFQNSNAQMYKNRALAFNPNSYLSARPTAAVILGPFTIEAWVNPTIDEDAFIVHKGELYTQYGISITDQRILVHTQNGIRLVSRQSSRLPIHQWTHFAAVYNGVNQFKIFINGIEDTSCTSPGHTPGSTTDSLYIGKRGRFSGVNTFKGHLDEIRIWAKQSYAEDIAQNFRTSIGYASGKYSHLMVAYTFHSSRGYGPLFFDYSGNSNTPEGHGVFGLMDYTNQPLTYLSSNEALELDGEGDYFRVPHSVAVSQMSQMSIEAWIYPRSQGGAIVAKNYQTSYYLGLTGSGKVRFIPRSWPNGYMDGNQTIPLNQWSHVAATYQNGTAKIYVNGVLDVSSTDFSGPVINNVDPLYIGADKFAGNDMGYFFDGFLDNVRVSNFAKSLTQIRNFMYQSIDESNRFDETAKELVYNFDGFGNSSTETATDFGTLIDDAGFSHPATRPNIPVSPVIRMENFNLAFNWTVKTLTNKTIPETGTSGLTKDSLFYGGTGTVGGLKLFVALNHSKVSDLEITLVSPSGDSVKVFDKYQYRQQQNELVTIFDDNTSFSTNVPSYYVSIFPKIKPTSLLENLYGGNVQGYWKLKIVDTKAADVGRIYAWGISNDALLPVELASLTASVHSNDVTLNWTTTSELNNSGFEIERMSLQNGQANGTWSKINFIDGNGSSSSSNSYSYTDKNLPTGSYNYRIKQIDFNGNNEYFDLENEVSIGIPVKYDLSQNYPNPFNPATKIDFSLPDNARVSLQVFDITGRLIQTLIENEFMSAGFHSKKFNGANVSSGAYFYKLSSGNFVMTKKMTLIK